MCSIFRKMLQGLVKNSKTTIFLGVESLRGLFLLLVPKMCSVGIKAFWVTFLCRKLQSQSSLFKHQLTGRPHLCKRLIWHLCFVWMMCLQLFLRLAEISSAVTWDIANRSFFLSTKGTSRQFLSLLESHCFLRWKHFSLQVLKVTSSFEADAAALLGEQAAVSRCESTWLKPELVIYSMDVLYLGQEGAEKGHVVITTGVIWKGEERVERQWVGGAIIVTLKSL